MVIDKDVQKSTHIKRLLENNVLLSSNTIISTIVNIVMFKVCIFIKYYINHYIK